MSSQGVPVSRWSKNLLRLSSVALGLSLFFSNCATNYEPAQYGNCPNGNCQMSSDGQMLSLSVLNDEVAMRCFQEYVDIGGTCNPGDYKLNMIKYTLVRDGFSETNSINGTCESGHYYLRLKRPNDPSAPYQNALNGNVEYRLNTQIFSANNVTDATTQGPQVTSTVRIQWPACNL